MTIIIIIMIIMIIIMIVIAMFIILSIHVDLVEHDEVWVVSHGDRLRGIAGVYRDSWRSVLGSSSCKYLLSYLLLLKIIGL